MYENYLKCDSDLIESCTFVGSKINHLIVECQSFEALLCIQNVTACVRRRDLCSIPVCVPVNQKYIVNITDVNSMFVWIRGFRKDEIVFV
jgi:hypothetical protein